MQKLFVAFVLSLLFAGSLARTIALLPENNDQSIVVLLDDAEQGELLRQKRQFGGGFGPYGQSSALANANAYNQYAGPDGFGASSALAGAQSFNSQGPLGGFGASAANSGSQGFHAGPGGFRGANANLAGSQSYNLPGGKNIALSYGAGYNVGPDGRPQVTNSNSLAYT